MGNHIDSMSKLILAVSVLNTGWQLGQTVYDGSIGTIYKLSNLSINMNAAFMAGLIDGLYEIKTIENNKDWNAKKQKLYECDTPLSVSFTQLYDPIYKKVIASITSSDITSSILSNPEEHMQNTGMNLLKAAEKISLKNVAERKASENDASKSTDQQEKVGFEERILAVKAGMIVVSGSINSQLFKLGKSAGKQIKNNIIATVSEKMLGNGPVAAIRGKNSNDEIELNAEEAITLAIKQIIVAWCYIMNNSQKVMMLPIEIINLSVSAISSFLMGMANQITDKQKVTYRKSTHLEFNEELMLNAISSIGADFIISYRTRMNALTSLDEKLAADNSVVEILQTVPGKKAQDLVMEKEFISTDMGKEINQYINIVRACTIAAKATVISSSCRLGEVAGDHLSKLGNRTSEISR